MSRTVERKQESKDVENSGYPRTPSSPNQICLGSQPSSQSQDPKSRRRLPGFLQNLWTMLNNPLINSIQWTGINSFEVKDKEDFTNRVLPMYFKHSKYTSFARLLRMYQFQKSSTVRSRWTHKFLIHGHYNSLYNIHRRKKSQKQKKWQVDAKTLRKTIQKFQVKIVSLKRQIEKLEHEIKVGKLSYQLFQSKLEEVQDLLKEEVESLEGNPRDKPNLGRSYGSLFTVFKLKDLQASYGEEE